MKVLDYYKAIHCRRPYVIRDHRSAADNLFLHFSSLKFSVKLFLTRTQLDIRLQRSVASAYLRLRLNRVLNHEYGRRRSLRLQVANTETRYATVFILTSKSTFHLSILTRLPSGASIPSVRSLGRYKRQYLSPTGT